VKYVSIIPISEDIRVYNSKKTQSWSRFFSIKNLARRLQLDLLGGVFLHRSSCSRVDSLAKKTRPLRSFPVQRLTQLHWAMLGRWRARLRELPQSRHKKYSRRIKDWWRPLSLLLLRAYSPVHSLHDIARKRFRPDSFEQPWAVRVSLLVCLSIGL
jgi:hypothetical protein